MEKVEELPLRSCRRQSLMKYVTGMKKDFDLMFVDLLFEPQQKGVKLLMTSGLLQMNSQMPI
jgi:hypothetical protein